MSNDDVRIQALKEESFRLENSRVWVVVSEICVCGDRNWVTRNAKNAATQRRPAAKATSLLAPSPQQKFGDLTGDALRIVDLTPRRQSCRNGTQQIRIYTCSPAQSAMTCHSSMNYGIKDCPPRNLALHSSQHEDIVT